LDDYGKPSDLEKPSIMGQSQSSGGGSPQNEEESKADYYDLLGVERQATDEE
jgi:hypothetical protein